jgi:ice-binding like protein/putative Ig domain-containing protein/exosortase sorting signal-containing protein
MASRGRRFHAFAGFAASILLSLPLLAMPPEGPAAPALGSAASFAVLGAAVQNSGPSRISGNLGVSPGNARNGFPPGNVVLGRAIDDEGIVRAAHKELAAANGDLAGRSCGTTLSGSLGGKTLGPGVYCFAADAELTGTLTLDARDNADAIWIFQIPGALTTAPESLVRMIHGAQRGNVYWQVHHASLGSGTTFVGNIVALANITLGAGASVSGRVLSRTGAITLDTNDVSLCCDAIVLSPPKLRVGRLNAAYSETIAAGGGAEPYLFSPVSGSLPNGLTLSAGGAVTGVPTVTGTFSFAVMVTDGKDCSRVQPFVIRIDACSLALSPATLPPATIGTPYSAMVAAAGGTAPYTFAVTSGALPPGLSFDVLTSEISGAPTANGAYDFTITATDANGCRESRLYTIRVGVAIPALSPYALILLCALLAFVAMRRTHG